MHTTDTSLIPKGLPSFPEVIPCTEPGLSPEQ